MNKHAKGTLRRLLCGILTVMALLALLLPEAVGEGDGDLPMSFTVGEDILAEDILEFYWTYDASTYPPEFLRYRLYAADEGYMFYCEKREGDHWPLTEADISFALTVPLAPEEWTFFFDCLRGGRVRAREDLLDDGDGDSGPWLYLYWRGDPGECQEFTFASWEKQESFEQMCQAMLGESWDAVP